MKRYSPCWIPFAIAALLAALVATGPAAAQRTRVTSIKPLLLTAIDRGEAHGALVGDGAAFMHKRFGTMSPIEIDVRAIGQLREPGCKRLEIAARQDGVRETQGGNAAQKEVIFQINYCRDGRLPGRGGQ